MATITILISRQGRFIAQGDSSGREIIELRLKLRLRLSLKLSLKVSYFLDILSLKILQFSDLVSSGL